LHGTFFAAGNGAGIYESLLRAQCTITGIDAGLFPSAEDVVPLALQRYAQGGAQAPEIALPVYLRDEVWKKLPGR
jgi:tRNA threonylcarbamoyladenosine biosynthesis protein TsaB